MAETIFGKLFCKWRVGLMPFTAANHKGAIKLFWDVTFHYMTSSNLPEDLNNALATTPNTLATA